MIDETVKSLAQRRAERKLAEHNRRRAAAQKAADTRRINAAKRAAEFIRNLKPTSD